MESDQKRLKILHILDHSLPVHSGYAFRSQAILRAQQRRGWETAGVTSPKHYESWQQHGAESEEVGGIRYYRTRGIQGSPRPVEKELRVVRSLASRIQAVAKQERPQVLHAHSPVLNALAALWVSRRQGIPIVYEIRALWEDAAVDRGAYGPQSWQYKIVRALETWVCRQVEEVTVLCRGIRDELRSRGIASEKLTIIPNGVDVTTFRRCESDREFAEDWNLLGKKVVGFLGSFFRYEGLDVLVKAMARLAATRSDTVLLLVGGGEVEKDLRAQVRGLGLDHHVIMPGTISPDRIPGVYALVDVLAFPRHAVRLTELVTPLKPLEAMAMEKLVVASDVGGHRELVVDGKTGLLFSAGDAEALAAVLARVLDEPHLCYSLAQQGAEWVRKERTWETTTACYSDVYARAIMRLRG
ncbi:MAG: TIGR04063 family PEP-CTERM/XrtA system glycosyltransferase [Candidatus Binatia bacterium]